MNEWLDKVMATNPALAPYIYGEHFTVWSATGMSPAGGTITPNAAAKPDHPWVIFDEANDSYTYSFPTSGLVSSEPRTAKPHECVHCYKPRHPGPITERVAGMLTSHRLDPDYDPDTDDSAIACIGSDYYGPVQDTRSLFPLADSTYSSIQALKDAQWGTSPGWATLWSDNWDKIASYTIPNPKWEITVETGS